jgi:tetratricopeptide (TPR) repeat protein
MAIAGATVGLLAGIVVLGLPYLSVREASVGNDIGIQSPTLALKDLKLASSLNPLDADPARYAGTIALQAGDFRIAQQRFRDSISREPGNWFSWFGAGLAASALGDPALASREFVHARTINSIQPAIHAAVVRVHSRHPLTTDEAFRMLVVVG